jgi:hypothetical protein
VVLTSVFIRQQLHFGFSMLKYLSIYIRHTETFLIIKSKHLLIRMAGQDVTQFSTQIKIFNFLLYFHWSFWIEDLRMIRVVSISSIFRKLFRPVKK